MLNHFQTNESLIRYHHLSLILRMYFCTLNFHTSQAVQNILNEIFTIYYVQSGDYTIDFIIDYTTISS